MDLIASSGLIYGIIAVIVAGGLLFMTRKAAPASAPASAPSSSGVGSYIPTLSTFQRWGRIAGILIPFILIAIGPLADMYYNAFRYTTISLVGISAMALGFLYQAIAHGTSAYLSSMTIGTSAILTYVLFDVWAQGDGFNFKVLTTTLGAVLMFLQLLHTASGPVFSSAILNDGVGTLLGSGFGAIAWAIVYNLHREYLPNSQPPKKATK